MQNKDISLPIHYMFNSVCHESMDVVKELTSKEELKGFYYGNILKYIMRFKKKDGVKDLKKAKQYIEWLIEELEDEKTSVS